MKQSPAAFLHIPPGRVEIVGVPRNGHLAGVPGKVHQQMHLAGTVDAMLGQLAAGWRIDRIADLLGAGSRRLDLNAQLQTGFLHQILHDELGHRASANIAVAEKKYPDHAPYTPTHYYRTQYSTEPQIRRVGFPDGRQNRFFSGVLPLTSRNNQQHEDTSAAPPAPCLLPE